MVRNYKSKKINPSPTEAELKNAMHSILHSGMSIRKVSTRTGINRSTLQLYFKKFDSLPSPDHSLKNPCHGNQVLSVQQEEELADYLIATSEEGYGLSPKVLKRLVYSYCRYNKITMPPNWMMAETAGPDWFRNFFKRNSRLFMRKPENTSQARAAALNHVVLEKFYAKIRELYALYNFTADRIFNVDETNDPTVLDSNKVLSRKGTHQVFHYCNHINRFKLNLILLILFIRFMVAKVMNEGIMSQCVPLSAPLVNYIQVFSFSPW